MKSTLSLAWRVLLGASFATSTTLAAASATTTEHLRDRLADAGITAYFAYDSIVAANVSGGLHSDQEFAGQINTGLRFDLEKLIGWESAAFNLSVVNRHGRSLADSVGSVFDPMCLTGGQTTFLYEVTLETALTTNLDLKLGRLAATDDFSTSPLYAHSLNNTVNGPIRALLLDGAMSSFPFPVWGGRLKYTPSDTHQFQVGVYQLSDRMWNRDDHGLDFSIRGEDGISLFAQYDWTGEIGGRPSRFYLGTNQAHFDFNRIGATGTTDTFARYYGHFDTELTDGLQAFVTLGYTDHDDVAIITLQSSLGLSWQGLLPGRPADRTVFFATYGEYSDDVTVTDAGNTADYEMVYELGHRIETSEHTYLQPAIQYIQRPGGTGEIKDSIVIGAWIGTSF